MLDKQLVDIPIGGLDQGSDTVRLAPSSPAVLENVRFDKTGRIAKRYGFRSIGSPQNAAHTLLTSSGQLVAVGNYLAAAYSSAVGWSTLPGGAVDCQDNFIDAANGQTFNDYGPGGNNLGTRYCVVGSYRAVATITGLRLVLTILDSNLRVVKVYTAAVSANAAVRILANGNTLVMFVVTSGSSTLTIYQISTTSLPAALSSPTNITLPANVNATFSVAAVMGAGAKTNRLFVVWGDATLTRIRLSEIDLSGTPSLVWTNNNTTTNNFGQYRTAIYYHAPTDYVFIAATTSNGSAVGPSLHRYNAVGAAFSVESVPFVGNTQPEGIPSVIYNSLTGVRILVPMISSGSGLVGASIYTWTTTGVVTDTGMRPWGKLLGAYYDTTTLRFVALMGSPSSLLGNVVAVTEGSTAGTVASLGCLGSVQVVGTAGVDGGEFLLLTAAVVTSIVTSFSSARANTASVVLRLFRLAPTRAQAAPWLNVGDLSLLAQNGPSLVLPAGLICLYPGEAALSTLSVSNAGGLITVVNGQSIGAAVAHELTLPGNLRSRGTPSTPLTAVAGASSSFGSATFSHRSLLTTDNSETLASNGIGVRQIAWRTTSNGTLYYLDPYVSQATPTEWDGTATNILTSSNETITTNEQLNFNEIQNVGAPTFTSMAFAAGRVWGLAAGGRELWFSKTRNPGFAPEFAAENVLQQDINDTLVAVASLDDKVVAFGNTRIFATAGEGPDNSGSGSFPTLQLVAGDIGCTANTPTITIPDGVVFQSSQGLRMLDRSLQVARNEDGGFWGSQVEDEFNGGVRVLSACTIPTLQEARWVLSSKRIVCYHWEQRMFSITTLDAAITPTACCFYEGAMAFVDSVSGNVYLEDTTRFYDGTSTWVGLRLRTGKISISNIKGFGRLYRILVEHVSKSAHGFSIKVYVDGEAAPSTTRTWSDAAGLTALEAHVAKQKGSYFEVELSDVAPVTIGTGESCTLAGMAWQVGIKPGFNKTLPAGSRK